MMAETPDLDSLSAKWREQANNFDDPRDYPLDDAYRTCADELDAARAAEKTQQAKRPVHPDPDCEFARGVGAYCTCETPEEKSAWIRYREEAQAERDEFEAGRVAARAADPLRREVEQLRKELALLREAARDESLSESRLRAVILTGPHVHAGRIRAPWR
jgi:hypothetical protein